MAGRAGDGTVTERKIAKVGASDAASSDTLIGKTHAQLRNDIITGVYAPNEKLRVEHLKRDYGVSSGTLREALTMLVADKLVIAEDQRGFRVVPVSTEDLIDLNRIRILLEKEAIRRAIAHGDENWEAKVVSTYHLLSRAAKALAANVKDQALFDEWERRHRAFHLALISATPSEWTRYFLGLSYQQFERYRHMFKVIGQETYKDRDVDAEHAEILDAVLARDADAAAASLEQHLARTLDEWLRYFEKVGALEADQTLVGGARRSKKSKKR